MIRHILSMTGCLIGFVMFLLMGIFTSNPDGIFFGQGAIAFLVLFFLVYWNLRIEVKKEDKIQESTKMFADKKTIITDVLIVMSLVAICSIIYGGFVRNIDAIIYGMIFLLFLSLLWIKKFRKH